MRGDIRASPSPPRSCARVHTALVSDDIPWSWSARAGVCSERRPTVVRAARALAARALAATQRCARGAPERRAMRERPQHRHTQQARPTGAQAPSKRRQPHEPPQATNEPLVGGPVTSRLRVGPRASALCQRGARAAHEAPTKRQRAAHQTPSRHPRAANEPTTSRARVARQCLGGRPSSAPLDWRPSLQRATERL